MTNKSASPSSPGDESQTIIPENINLISSVTTSDISLTKSSPNTPDTGIASIENQVQSFISTPGLSEHRFIRLTEYSLLRALVQNAAMLALDFFLLMNDEALSPWTLSNPYPALTTYDLSPTTTQLRTPHHPYLDIIASPAFRDNILLACLDEDVEDQLCLEMHADAFTVWGSQPWNAMGMLTLSFCCVGLVDDLCA